jgi:hypothetical protein
VAVSGLAQLRFWNPVVAINAMLLPMKFQWKRLVIGMN